MRSGARAKKPDAMMDLEPILSLRWPTKGAKKEGMVRMRKRKDTCIEL